MAEFLNSMWLYVPFLIEDYLVAGFWVSHDCQFGKSAHAWGSLTVNS